MAAEGPRSAPSPRWVSSGGITPAGGRRSGHMSRSRPEAITVSIQERTRELREASTSPSKRYKIARRDLIEQPTAVVRAHVPADDLGGWLGIAHHLVARFLRRHGLKPAGPPFARLAIIDGTAVVEAGFPVNRPIDTDGEVEPSSLPGGPAAVTTHRGHYEGLETAFETLANWVTTHGRAPAGPHWEIYETDPNAEPDPRRWRTQIVVPYLRRTVRPWWRRR
ncbi:GyrI-like domain-containing protein [Jiangella mangrovi]|uniref:Effector-binding domain-containing protein n=1 Tax=Jiangella mangrovi TaxID=1524084 RepID=A0A7W9GRU7_9ACTN|nr:GyrI-like domain-containing protein [Jiangella mangrovi]MBB5788767.1 effector-binding domain-containing protein [Jiangella mangrovi]